MYKNTVWDHTPQRSVLDRTIRAQVNDIDYENGIITCNYDGQPSGGKYVTVAPLWMSFPEVGGAAWGRFMPQRSDLIKLGFGYDDHPHMVGYDVQAGSLETADGRVGWPQLTKLYNSAVSSPDSKKTVNRNGIVKEIGISGYGKFIPLKPGEYDFMSSGGAYIRGTDSGKLYMAGGGASISIIKNELLISSMAQLSMCQSDNSIFRFGQVRRLDDNLLNAKIADDSDGLFKEFCVLLKTDADVNDSKDLAYVSIGNVVGEDGAISKVDDKELRYLVKTYNTNSEITYSHDTAVDGTTNILSKSDYHIGAKSVNLHSDGGTADHPLILSNTYKDKETAMISDLVSQIKSLSTAVDTLCKTIGSAPAAIGPVIPYAAALAAAANVTSAQLIAVNAQLTLISQKFSQDWPSFLSKICKTE